MRGRRPRPSPPIGSLVAEAREAGPVGKMLGSTPWRSFLRPWQPRAPGSAVSRQVGARPRGSAPRLPLTAGGLADLGRAPGLEAFRVADVRALRRGKGPFRAGQCEWPTLGTLHGPSLTGPFCRDQTAGPPRTDQAASSPRTPFKTRRRARTLSPQPACPGKELPRKPAGWVAAGCAGSRGQLAARAPSEGQPCGSQGLRQAQPRGYQLPLPGQESGT